MKNKNKFLYKAAFDLYEKFGKNNELSDVVIITPSKRAKFFLNKYFSEFAGENPIWSPEYAGIPELFAKVADLQLLDEQIQKILIIADLYKEYKNIVSGSVETFDEFYSFGEILLNDFDEIDKYLVDTKYIFKNLNDLKTMQDFSFLSEEQIEVLQRFMNFDETKLTRDFSNVWNNLKKVYDNFTAKLKAQKVGYYGLIMREVAENLDIYGEKFTAKKYVFVGFNSFSNTEKLLADYLKNENKAVFYWDYCAFLGEEKTKEFDWIVDYYKNELEIKTETKLPEIKFVEAVNSVSQIGFLPEYLKDKTDTETAIILCDEKLLLPVLSVVPKEINVAILANVSQAQITNTLFSFMKNSSAASPQNLLEELSAKIDGEKSEDNFEIAVAAEIKKMLNGLTKITAVFEKNESLQKIIRQNLFTMRIPYSSEETEKLQIMAMSDTRNMDFENIFILSANENLLPKSSAQNSFIPQSIRKAFGLPTTQMQDFQEQYNFYRLIQRAENVVFSYSTGKSGISKGEKSRFLKQLEYKMKPKKIPVIALKNNLEMSSSETEKIEINKTDEMLAELQEKYKQKPLSPSALNNYIDCSLQFYFRYVAGIKKPDEKELNSAALGKIFHRTMELIYKENGGLSNEKIIEKAFHDEKFGEYYKTGEGMIIFNVVSRMLKNTLEYDKNRENFEVIGLEETHFFERNGIKIGGIVDRIDKTGDKIRIVDYKTGGHKKIVNYEFQTYLYSLALKEKFAENQIFSELIFVLKNPIKAEQNNGEKNNEFEEKLNTKLKELFDKNNPFKQCDNEETCKYCDYAGICGR